MTNLTMKTDFTQANAPLISQSTCDALKTASPYVVGVAGAAAVGAAAFYFGLPAVAAYMAESQLATSMLIKAGTATGLTVVGTAGVAANIRDWTQNGCDYINRLHAGPALTPAGAR